MKGIKIVCVAALAWIASVGTIAAADTVKSDWPQWRGPKRDGKSGSTGLLTSWPSAGPKLLWTYRNAGNGFSASAVVDGVVYSLGSDDQGEFAFALNLADGKEIWKKQVSPLLTNNWGDGPRSTPTVDGDHLYVLMAKGDIACLERKTGTEVWRKSCTSDFGGKVPYWGYSESPLVDGDKVIVTPGGTNCIVALNKTTGEVVWKSTGLSDEAHYSSLVVADVKGKRMYVTQTANRMVGVDAETGKLLWKFGQISRKTAVIPTPVVVDNRIYSTSGYEAGCEFVTLTLEGDQIIATKAFVNAEMKNHHGGVIEINGHIFGHSDSRSGKPGWTYQNLADGAVVWQKNKRRNDKDGLEKGSTSFADGLFYCFGERSGDCVLVDASPKSWIEKGRMALPEKSKLNRKSGAIWAHPVIADGKLILRDLDLVFCFDVKAN